jgi:hypothetical protein
LFLVRTQFDDTKGAIRIHKSKKERQHNGQKKKDKRTNIDLQNITHKTKDRVIRTPAKYRDKRCLIRLYLRLFVGGRMSYLRYLCLFAYSGVQQAFLCLLQLHILL